MFRLDWLAYTPCNVQPPPDPSVLTCVVPLGFFEPGPHIASLRLQDPVSGSSCSGHAPWTVALASCGDPGGDANLDGASDLADLPALLREFADGDGTAVIDAGGGDLSAPGGDVTRDWLLTASDLEAILAILFAGP